MNQYNIAECDVRGPLARPVVGMVPIQPPYHSICAAAQGAAMPSSRLAHRGAKYGLIYTTLVPLAFPSAGGF